MAKRPPKSGYPQQNNMVSAIDRLRAFEEFETLLLPQLRADLKAGLTADEIYKKYEHLAAARSVTIAMSEQDSAKALSAVKEIRDRNSGKAVEKKEVTHKLNQLPDEQLDALLLTELDDMEMPTITGNRQDAAVPKKRGRPSKGRAIQKKMEDGQKED